jgi:gamma-glutamyltranspeptidase / glutathione hydrolase
MEHGTQHIGLGIMGGMNQPLAHAQFVSNVVDYHMNIQAALEEPRFTVSEKLGCNIVIESRFRQKTYRSSAAWGMSWMCGRNIPPRWGAGKQC